MRRLLGLPQSDEIRSWRRGSHMADDVAMRCNSVASEGIQLGAHGLLHLI
jgi:hypothetical protein